MRFRPLAALLGALTACAPKPSAAPAEVTFTATDFAFAGPDSIPPGFTTVHLANNGHQDHHLMLGRLDDGKTLQDLIAFAQAHPGAEPPFMSWHGAANAVGPSLSTAGTVDLPAGHYVAICFMPDPMDGRDHLSKGMIKELVVTGTRSAAQAPQTQGEIRLKDFGFEAPSIGAGTHTFHVVNDGPQTHELQLVRLNQGATANDYLAALAPGAKSPPPGLMLGGPGAFSKGGDGYWSVAFEPGNYIFICFVPDGATGLPHMMKGMVHEFTVPTT